MENYYRENSSKGHDIVKYIVNYSVKIDHLEKKNSNDSNILYNYYFLWTAPVGISLKKYWKSNPGVERNKKIWHSGENLSFWNVHIYLMKQ